jgi:molybdopterin/thiamine biosynthesis adenylyltransferase
MSTRYDRQLPLIGEDGQEKLAHAKIGIAGCGGLGTSAVTALASAGVGELVLADPDTPDITNFNRQYVYRPTDTETPKAELLRSWAEEVNPDCRVEDYVGAVSESSAGFVFSGCDMILDCLDSVTARRALNRWCVGAGMTLVHAGVTGFTGQVTVVVPGKTPCLECLYGHVRETTEHTPSIGAAVATVGSIEAAQAIILVTGKGEPLVGKMLTVDLTNSSSEVVEVSKNPDCPVCGRLSH